MSSLVEANIITLNAFDIRYISIKLEDILCYH